MEKRCEICPNFPKLLINLRKLHVVKSRIATLPFDLDGHLVNETPHQIAPSANESAGEIRGSSYIVAYERTTSKEGNRLMKRSKNFTDSGKGKRKS